MYCCIPDLSRCFKATYRSFFPKSHFFKVILILILLILVSLSRFRREAPQEAPFCQNHRLPDFVSSPPSFGPPISSSALNTRIEPTPQNTSGLWVLYNYLSPLRPPKNNFVTLTTHITSDFLAPELTELVIFHVSVNFSLFLCIELKH